MGRPTKCTPDVRERVVQAILANAPQAVAAARGGIGETTHYQWMARGLAAGEQAYDRFEALPEEDRPDDPLSLAAENDRPYAEYREAVEDAQHEWELRQAAIIARGAGGTPVYRIDGEGRKVPTEPWEETTRTTKVEERALVEGELRIVNSKTTTVTTAKRGIPGNTTDAKWMLERRRSATYGKVWRAEIMAPDGEPVEKDLDEFVAELRQDADELAARRQRRLEHEARQAETPPPKAEGNGQE